MFHGSGFYSAPQIAGTKNGLTAVQLDTKLPGVDLHLLEAAMKPAAAARRKILAAMESALNTYESSKCVRLPGQLAHWLRS
jgi:polyribonucleotide nucleotidyltransferase